ncbi:MAG: hypothetical protein SCH39_08230 [Methanosarcinales archaeon]|nr:hypothetical protein [ANME-2 cluster archaeon]MDF1531851.1 hypothetical protein [ANME-2 cluster archaeon]MDW7776304.1 hypothetical protein [Methanosarcinales archaeon]
MKVTIEFDYTQKDLMGDIQVLDIPEHTTLLVFLECVDTLIEEACTLKGVGSGKFKILNRNGNLNSCIATVNDEAPPDLLEHCLQEGDTISLLYGYCGG